MDDKYGLKAAADRGITLGEIGAKNAVRKRSRPRCGRSGSNRVRRIDFHIHHHPYLVVSLGGGENEIETISGRKITTHEPSAPSSSSTKCGRFID